MTSETPSEEIEMQLVDAADRVDRLFDLVGDLGLDLLRGRADQTGGDGDRSGSRPSGSGRRRG